MKAVYLNRGLSGSGKTTRALRLRDILVESGDSVVIVSNDHFLTDPVTGVYHWTPELATRAKDQCLKAFAQALADGVDAVIVDNTNLSAKVCRPFVEQALKAGYRVVFLEPDTPWAFDLDVLVERNTHAVPRAALEQQLRAWQPDMTVEKALGKAVAA